MTKRILLGLMAALFSSLLLQAQNWTNYSNISAVMDVEPFGTELWVAGKGGLMIHNTLTGENTYHKKSATGLPSNNVEQLVRTAEDVIWVGTYESGVAEWDGDTWTSYPFPTDLMLYRMKADLDGNLWLQTATGLYKFDTDARTYTFVNSVGGAGWDFNAWDFDITSENEVLIFTGTKMSGF